MKILRSLLLIAFSFTINSVLAQMPTKVWDSDDLEAQEEMLVKWFPGTFNSIEILKVQPLTEKHAKVEYLKDSVYHEAVINRGTKDMLLLETAAEINQQSIPKIVIAAVTGKGNEFSNWEISRAFIVTRPYGSVLYRMDMAPPSGINKKIQTIYVDKFGHPEPSPF